MADVLVPITSRHGASLDGSGNYIDFGEGETRIVRGVLIWHQDVNDLLVVITDEDANKVVECYFPKGVHFVPLNIVVRELHLTTGSVWVNFIF